MNFYSTFFLQIYCFWQILPWKKACCIYEGTWFWVSRLINSIITLWNIRAINILKQSSKPMVFEVLIDFPLTCAWLLVETLMERKKPVVTAKPNLKYRHKRLEVAFLETLDFWYMDQNPCCFDWCSCWNFRFTINSWSKKWPVHTRQQERLVPLEALMNEMEPVTVETYYFKKLSDKNYWNHRIFGLTKFWRMDQKNGYPFYFVSVSKTFLIESLMKWFKPVVDEKHAFEFRFYKT